MHYCSLLLHCYLIILGTSQVNSYFVVGKLLLLLIDFFLLLINSFYLLFGSIVVLLGFFNCWSTPLVALLVVVWFFLLCWLHYEKTSVLQLPLQLNFCNFWIASDICNSLYLYVVSAIGQVATHYMYGATHYNLITTIFFQLLCNSPMTTIIMSC